MFSTYKVDLLNVSRGASFVVPAVAIFTEKG